MKLFLLLLIIVGYSPILMAQPNTEIYLLNMNRQEDGSYSISNPVNISNNDGYDNQPSFWPDGRSILYARTEKGQTEIARYYISNGQTDIITHTLQGSEYSPTPTPDGKISSVRLDSSGLQLLYSYDLNGNSEVLVQDLVIGYHAWVDENKLISFVLGEPSTLQLTNLKNQTHKILASNIGRSIHKIPSTKSLSYVDKSGDQWTIKAINPKNGKSEDLVITKPGSEDYCWTPKREILMGEGSKLWMWTPYKGWVLLGDLSNYGLSGITRISSSPNGELLAIVVNK